MTTTTLPRATPASRTVDAAGMLGFLDAIETAGLELHSVMLFHAGAVVADGFWAPYGPDRLHAQHSATKSWTATGLGLAVAEGRLSLADKVVGFFPDQCPAEISDNLAAMSVEDLLTMRTGHATGISGGEWRRLQTSWVEAFLREPVVEAPGTSFIYSSATSYMLSAIVSKVTGELLHDYMKPRLFDPMGMAPMTWDVSPEGYNTGGNGLSCITENVMKFGVLHLQNGLWEGRQLLPADWVRAATRNHVAEVWMGAIDGRRFLPRGAGSPVERREGYGYQWWMTAHGGYRASGFYGQQCLVLPQQDAVFVCTAGILPTERRLFPAIWEHLLPAFGRGGTAASDATLAARLAGLALASTPGATHAAGEPAGHKRYRIEPNEDGVSEVSFTFGRDVCRFNLKDARGKHAIEAGLGQAIEGETSMSGAILHHQYESDSLRVVARGVWLDDRRFEMTWRFVETAFADTVLCRFEGDGVRIDRRVNTNIQIMDRPTLVGRAA
jgi:CubicO group peptidase (beta-lactamase class C family)